MNNIREKMLQRLLVLWSTAMCAFQLYTAAVHPLQAMPQRGVHLLFLLPIAFCYELLKPAVKNRPLLIGMGLAAMLSSLYLVMNWAELQNRTTRLVPLDYVMAIIMIGVVLFLTWRCIGIWMPLIAALFLVYTFVGPYIPGIFSFPKISFRRIIATMYCGTEGLFGTCLGATATFVFTFVLFGEFLVSLGAGDFFIELAEITMGRVRGGIGKIAVITSALFGMISGSPAANVAATGCLTIPLMKKAGYRSEYAGGVVAAAASGGVIMPPVMGTGAFIMAELIGVSYGKICIAATFPAALYFLALLLMVDTNAVKNGLAKQEVRLERTARDMIGAGWHYVLCIAVLLTLLVGLDWSPAKSAVCAIATLLATDFLKKIFSGRSYDWRDLVRIFTAACKTAVPVTVSTTCAGIIIGAFNATGLNLRLSSILISLSAGKPLVLLALTMFCALILGMGLPATPVYILIATMVGPALTQMGIPKLAAHLFIFYFGSMASITPPVGTAFYISAGLAKADPMHTGFVAWYTALPAFILPYIWIYDPGFLLEGSWGSIIWSVITGVIAIVALAHGLEGYLLAKLGPIPQSLLVIAALLVVIPGVISSLIGFGLIGAVLGIQTLRKRTCAV